MSSVIRRHGAVLALYFLSPLVAEYFSGTTLPIILLILIVPLSLYYGSGVLLIRELTRRTGRGWPTILLLGLAFGILEEGVLTQSLFNPDYLAENLHLLDPGYLKPLGIGALWTVFVLGGHSRLGYFAQQPPEPTKTATVRRAAHPPRAGDRRQ